VPPKVDWAPYAYASNHYDWKISTLDTDTDLIVWENVFYVFFWKSKKPSGVSKQNVKIRRPNAKNFPSFRIHTTLYKNCWFLYINVCTSMPLVVAMHKRQQMWLEVVFRPKSLGLYRPTIHVITVTFFTIFTFFWKSEKTWLFTFFCFFSHVFSNYDWSHRCWTSVPNYIEIEPTSTFREITSERNERTNEQTNKLAWSKRRRKQPAKHRSVCVALFFACTLIALLSTC